MATMSLEKPKSAARTTETSVWAKGLGSLGWNADQGRQLAQRPDEPLWKGTGSELTPAEGLDDGLAGVLSAWAQEDEVDPEWAETLSRASGGR